MPPAELRVRSGPQAGTSLLVLREGVWTSPLSANQSERLRRIR